MKRSAEVKTNSPIVPTGKEIKDGVLTVTYKQSDDFLGKPITTTTNGTTETFYICLLYTSLKYFFSLLRYAQGQFVGQCSVISCI